MSDWKSAPFVRPAIGPMGWWRVAWRGGLLATVTYGGLFLLLVLRLIEWPLFGLRRPWTPHITQGVCRAACGILHLPVGVRGAPMVQTGAMVANHASWLDIFVLNACTTLYFVAKSEVRGWAGIGWLARATGTLFIARKGTEARTHQAMLEQRLQAGHRLLFFPEGTSTDSLRVLPFKSTLFAAFFSPALVRDMHVQPVTLQYTAPKGADPRFYGWWGDMDFAGHLVMLLAAPRQGRVEVIFHPPVPVDAFEGRKPLASYCQRVIATTLPPGGGAG